MHDLNYFQGVENKSLQHWDPYSSQYDFYLHSKDLFILELLELAHNHLYPKFSLGCFEIFSEKYEMVADENTALYLSSGQLGNQLLGQMLGSIQEVEGSTQSQIPVHSKDYVCHHNISLTAPTTEKLPTETQ